MFALTERGDEDGAQIFAITINGAALVPAHPVWGVVDANEYASLETVTENDFTELGVFNAVGDVPDFGLPSIGAWGTLFAGRIGTTEIQAFWIGDLGERLVFGGSLLTVPDDYEIYGNPQLTRVGIASTLAVWTERYPDDTDPKILHSRVAGQRFVCSASL